MATYKVLQDIEAEDKLLGPLTLKQFIFAIITIGIGFMCFRIATTPALSVIRWPLVAVLLLPMLIFGFLAAPIGRDQPNDIWLLARLRFLVRPHARVWNQDGLSELVSINVPRREVHNFTNNLSQSEVRSRLSALANTLDSRGWAVKNVSTNLYSQPDYVTSTASDRLVDPSSLPQEVRPIDVVEADDMLDTVHNSTAQHLDQLVQASTQAHKEMVAEQVRNPYNRPQAPADYWFMNEVTPPSGLKADYTVFGAQPVVHPGAPGTTADVPVTAEEKAALEHIQQGQSVAAPYTGHLKVLQPLHDRDGNIIQQPQPPAAGAPLGQPAGTVPPDPYQQQTANPYAPQYAPQAQPQNTASTSVVTPDPAILGLPYRDDLNVDVVARMAQRANPQAPNNQGGKRNPGDDGEVVISLH